MNEFGLSRSQVKQILTKYNDLKVQSMMFDMDIDIETRSLVEKRVDPTPGWVQRWQDKRDAEDLDEYFDMERMLV